MASRRRVFGPSAPPRVLTNSPIDQKSLGENLRGFFIYFGFLQQLGKLEAADILESAAAMRFKNFEYLLTRSGVLKHQRAHILATLERYQQMHLFLSKP